MWGRVPVRSEQDIKFLELDLPLVRRHQKWMLGTKSECFGGPGSILNYKAIYLSGFQE